MLGSSQVCWWQAHSLVLVFEHCYVIIGVRLRLMRDDERLAVGLICGVQAGLPCLIFFVLKLYVRGETKAGVLLAYVVCCLAVEKWGVAFVFVGGSGSLRGVRITIVCSGLRSESQLAERVIVRPSCWEPVTLVMMIRVAVLNYLRARVIVSWRRRRCALNAILTRFRARLKNQRPSLLRVFWAFTCRWGRHLLLHHLLAQALRHYHGYM